jgi:hypothetical protein
MKMRLEKTSRDCRSLRTFYLDRTLRSLGLEFTVSGMRQAHSDPWMRSEVWTHIDRASAQGLALGSWFPDLSRHLYNKPFDAAHPVVEEMNRHGIAHIAEPDALDIDERARSVANWIRACTNE